MVRALSGKEIVTTEDELLAAIRKVLSAEDPGVIVPIGDDAAVVDPGGHHTVLTVDTLVDGVHFDRSVAGAHDIGFKAVTVNVSDVAAMGGSPRYGLVALALPPDVELAWVMELYGGMRQAADQYALSLVGGDTVRSDRVVVSVTVMGRVAEGRAARRSGARPGDALVVTGALGGAAGGLRIIRSDPAQGARMAGTDWGRELLSAQLRPMARVGEAETLVQAGTSAMMDISDGLALDLWRMCTASGVGARVVLDQVPVDPALGPLADAEGIDPLELALHGGEDYELLAALPPEAVEDAAAKIKERFGTTLASIGAVTERGFMAVGSDGRERPLEPRGWDHFA
jgi:thiamine-monophosphate kinase